MKHLFPIIALAAVSLFHVPGSGAEVSHAAVVKFNTACARCHEGECSGRLSFSSGAAATQGHVQRHLPSASPLDVEELFAILKYTKEQCAHYPLPGALPANGLLDEETLRQWHGADGEGYFIPLGRVHRGEYHLTLRFDRASEASVRVTSENFEVLLEQQQCKNMVVSLTLPVAAEAFYYLQIRSSATLLRLTLLPER